MRRRRVTEEKIALPLKQAERGTLGTEICRKFGNSEATFYRWERWFGDLGVREIKDLRQGLVGTRKLKGLVANPSLHKTKFQVALRKCW